MKNRFFITTMIFIAVYLLSACGGASQPAAPSPAGQAAVKVQAVEVAFTGVVEAINGDQWTVNGQALSVDPGVVRDGPFQAGDTVKIEGAVNADGSITVSRVAAPSAADLTGLPQLGNENGNANGNEGNTNDANENANSNDDNTNDTNTNDNADDGNSNDDNSNDTDDNSNDDDSNNTNDNTNEDDGNSNDDDSNSNDDGGNSNEDDDNGGNSNEDDKEGNGNEDDDDDNSNND